MVRKSGHDDRKSGMLVAVEFGFVHKLIDRCNVQCKRRLANPAGNTRALQANTQDSHRL